jgi:hypothetical protein
VFDSKGEVISQGNISCRYFDETPEETAERIGAPNLYRLCNNWGQRLVKNRTSKPFNKFRYKQ